MDFYEILEDVKIIDENTIELDNKEFKLSENIYLYNYDKDFDHIVKQAAKELRGADFIFDINKASSILRNNIFFKLSNKACVQDVGNDATFRVDDYGNLYLSYYDGDIKCSVRQYTGFFKYIPKQKALEYISKIAYEWDSIGLEDSKIGVLYNSIMQGLDKLNTPELMLKYSRPIMQESTFHAITFDKDLTKLQMTSSSFETTPDICFNITGVSKAEDLLNSNIIKQLQYIAGSNFLQKALDTGLFKVVFEKDCSRLYVCTIDTKNICSSSNILDKDYFKLDLFRELFSRLDSTHITKSNAF